MGTCIVLMEWVEIKGVRCRYIGIVAFQFKHDMYASHDMCVCDM